MGSVTELNVDTGKLASYGAYLVGCQDALDKNLKSLDEKMATITNGWSDEDGQTFKTKFSAFITEAKNINLEVASLGAYAVKVALKYDELLRESLRQMGE